MTGLATRPRSSTDSTTCSLAACAIRKRRYPSCSWTWTTSDGQRQPWSERRRPALGGARGASAPHIAPGRHGRLTWRRRARRAARERREKRTLAAWRSACLHPRRTRADRRRCSRDLRFCWHCCRCCRSDVKADEVLRDAELAIYSASSSHPDFAVDEPAMHEQAMLRLQNSSEALPRVSDNGNRRRLGAPRRANLRLHQRRRNLGG